MPAAGIPEVWIVNRPVERIESYADPVGDEYATVGTTALVKASRPKRFPTLFWKSPESSETDRRSP